MSKLNHSRVIQLMEEWAPKKLAYDWDPTGFQLGNRTSKTKNILITLDVVERVVDEAIEKGVNLIISHHPLIFSPLKSIDITTPKGRTIEKLLKHNITVYTSHTNLDIAEGGVNDLLAKQLDLKVIDDLVHEGNKNLFKVAVYLPKSHAKAIREAFHKGGAGHIGNYSHCTFQGEGKGSFKPLQGSDPYSGRVDKLSLVDEYKMESIVPEQNLQSVIKEIEKAHPYDEVAYDVYRLENKGKSYGLGRIGLLQKEMNLDDFAQFVKERYNLEGLKVTGDLKSKVNRVAILGGSGEKYIFAAKSKGVDAFVTGDMTFHFAQDAMEMGLNIIDAGHYIEKVMIDATKQYLEDCLKVPDLNIYSSTVNTNPFKYI